MDDKSEDIYYRRFSDTESDSIWGNYMKMLRIAVEDSMRIVLSAGITLQARERNKLLKLHKDFLTEEEKGILDFLERQLEKSDEIIKIIYVIKGQEILEEPKTKPELMKRVISKLRELLDKQQSALDTLEQRIESIAQSMQQKRKKRS